MKIHFPVWLKVLLAALIVMLLVKAFAFTSCTIPSTGMENTLYQGERILVNKWSYGLRLPFTTTRIHTDKAEKGDVVLFNNPIPDKEKPLFATSLFISRCMGTPGDTLMLNDELLVTGEQTLSPDSKALYAYPYEQEDTLLHILKELNIEGNQLVGYTDGCYLRSFSHYEYYLLKQKLTALELRAVHQNDTANSHPFVIPACGQSVKVYPWNVVLLCNTIVHHEQANASVKGDTLYVNGKAVDSYRFKKDYYWMVSNNPINMADSRLFGLVPHECLIGKAYCIWYSTKKERIFQLVE